MPSDYSAIKQDNLKSYGTKVENYGRIFFEEIYSDKNHFIFELLQNAEDALVRSEHMGTSGVISFDLRKDHLRVSHFGVPFTEDDVRGICAIAESTKSATDIGRFGIGFKSVYAYTDRPEVHSGTEAFAIEHYVWPEAIPPIDRNPELTVFLFPFKDGGDPSYGEISLGLEKLGREVLLFLRQIDEVTWTVEDGRRGSYQRKEERRTDSVRRVTLLSGDTGSDAEEYLVFSRPVKSDEGPDVGFVEIAFLLSDDRSGIRQVGISNLVVFFPTVVPTDLGFLTQGPYRTTPTRETVPPADEWNQHLGRETAELLRETLRWFRDHDLLAPNLLECLPLHRPRRSTEMLEPLFDTTKDALTTETLLPRADGGYVRGREALLARGQGVRDLLESDRVSQVFPGKRGWLSAQITQDRTPRLHKYLREEIGVDEVTPDYLVRSVDRSFLEVQSDEWMVRLYEFLNSRKKGLTTILPSVYLIRLEDGTHVTPQEVGVYLPGEIETDYQTVKKTVCRSPDARHLLESLGLRKVDFMDDIVGNLLPVYSNKPLEPDQATIATYRTHIRRILNAYKKANREQRDRLISRLIDAYFVLSVDHTGVRSFRKPEQVYYPTDSLRTIFAQVEDIYFVDTAYIPEPAVLIGELFRKCGVRVRLRPMIAKSTESITRRDLAQWGAYLPSNMKEERVIDWDVHGIEDRLRTLKEDTIVDRRKFGEALWKELIHAKDNNVKSSKAYDPVPAGWGTRWFSTSPSLRSRSLLYGKYETFYYRRRGKEFASSLVRRLRSTCWVADHSGELHRPSEVEFDSLDWDHDDELLSLIEFKTPEPEPEPAYIKQARIDRHINQLAKAAGNDPEDLRKRLHLAEELQKEGISIADVKEFKKRRRSREETSSAVTATDGATRTEDTGGIISYREALAAKMRPYDREVPAKHGYLPEGGPQTTASAVEDTERSADHGRSGSRRTHTSISFVSSREAQKLERKFRDMAGGDYDGRCQICGTTFLRPDGESQRFITHIVDPAGHRRSNHYGNLLSLCGLHHALVKWGNWSAIDVTGAPVDNFLDAASEQIDDNGGACTDIRVRFMGLYPSWQPQPKNLEEVIRFSQPHWEYHRQLFKTEEK